MEGKLIPYLQKEKVPAVMSSFLSCYHLNAFNLFDFCFSLKFTEVLLIQSIEYLYRINPINHHSEKYMVNLCKQIHPRTDLVDLKIEFMRLSYF